MVYLTEQEIPKYCINPKTPYSYIQASSSLIEAYKGCSFGLQVHTEKVVFFKKPRERHPLTEYRGKLIHAPRVEVTEIKTYGKTFWGDREPKNFEVDTLLFDAPTSPYFTFFPPMTDFFGATPPISFIYVTYTSGYAEGNYPEELKRAVGMLANNLAQVGGTLQWVSRDDYDVKVTLSDKSIFTDEIKKLVDMVVVS